MLSSKNIIIAILFCSLIPFAGAEEPRPAAETDQALQEIEFPYIAEVTGADVYVRSGPGTAYYFCDKLNAPEQVIVAATENDWSKIIPPPGGFSWVSKSYVRLDTDNPQIGIITGDAVRIWAGSNFHAPERSSSQQTKLNEGDTVKLMAEPQESAPHYKIFPPAGAYLWINSQYLKYVGPVEKPKPAIPPTPESPEAVLTDVIPLEMPIPEKTIPSEAGMLEKYLEIVEKIDAELTKPLSEQDYEEIKKSLSSLGDKLKTSKAARYAEYQLERIARFELARQVNVELNDQDAELAEALAQIRKRRSEKLKDVLSEVEFIVTGKLKASQIYTGKTGPKRYVIVNKSGKILCYAVSTDSAIALSADKLIGLQVGLTGEVISDPSSSTGLIEFTEIVELSLPSPPADSTE